MEFLYFLFESYRPQQHRLLYYSAVLPGLLQTQESIPCSDICPVFRITTIWTVFLLTQGLHNTFYRTAALILFTDKQKNPIFFLPSTHIFLSLNLQVPFWAALQATAPKASLIVCSVKQCRRETAVKLLQEFLGCCRLNNFIALYL